MKLSVVESTNSQPICIDSSTTLIKVCALTAAHTKIRPVTIAITSVHRNYSCVITFPDSARKLQLPTPSYSCRYWLIQGF